MQAQHAPLAIFAATLFCAIATATVQMASKPTGLDNADQLAAVQPVRDNPAAFAFTELRNGVQVRVGGALKNVLFYGPRIVRVNTTLGSVHTKQASLP